MNTDKELTICISDSPALAQFLMDLENKTKDIISQNSGEWFQGKTVTAHQIDDSFVSLFESGVYYKIKNTKNTTFFDKYNKEQSVVQPNSTGVCVIGIKGIWFSSSNYGLIIQNL